MRYLGEVVSLQLNTWDCAGFSMGYLEDWLGEGKDQDRSGSNRFGKMKGEE